LKFKINPAEIKVGINTFSSLKNGEVLIETNINEEIEALERISTENAEENWKLTFTN